MNNCLKDKRYTILSILVFSLACFGFNLLNHYVGIDENSVILTDKVAAGWIGQGRFGLYFLDVLLSQSGRYAPFLWDFLSILIWAFAGVIFYVTLFSLREEQNNNNTFDFCMFVFAGYFISVPCVVGEILSFSMMNLHVSIGMALTAVSVYYAKIVLFENKFLYIVAAIFCLSGACSIYQAFIGVYVTGIVALLLNSVLAIPGRTWNGILKSILIASAAVFLYFISDQIFQFCYGMQGDTYLNNTFIGWGSGLTPLEVIKGTFKSVLKFLLNIKLNMPWYIYVYGGNLLRFISILAFIICFFLINEVKTLDQRLWVIFLSLSLIIAPYIMYILLGTQNMQGRFLLGIPLCQAYFIATGLHITQKRNKVIRNIILVGSIYILFLNARNMNILFYNASIVAEHDKVIANELMYDIKRKGFDYSSKPIVYIGACHTDYIDIQTTDTIGHSIFQWDGGNPYRIQTFLETEGYLTLIPSANLIQQAYTTYLSADMQPWPNENSIIETENSIIVFFSTPTEQWFGVNGVQK